MHHPFTTNDPGDTRCIICGSTDELNHFWACAEHKMVGNGRFACGLPHKKYVEA